MYIHIGSNRMLRGKEIVGIFDLDGEITTQDTQAFLRRIDNNKRAELAGDDLPRSFVLVCGEGKDDRVIYSRLTTQALAKRTEKDRI